MSFNEFIDPIYLKLSFNIIFPLFIFTSFFKFWCGRLIFVGRPTRENIFRDQPSNHKKKKKDVSNKMDNLIGCFEIKQF